MLDLNALDRRGFLKAAGFSALAATAGSRRALASALENEDRRCILLWMSGGPSQLDTFDPKPGHVNAGPVEGIETAVPGVRFSEYLPNLAERAGDLYVVRSMKTKEGDHGRATEFVRTGHLPGGVIDYPSIGALAGAALADGAADLPPFVSVLPTRALAPAGFSSGFLGPKFAPLVIGENAAAATAELAEIDRLLKVENLTPPVAAERQSRRIALLKRMQQGFRDSHPDAPVVGHASAYERALRMMSPRTAEAFDLTGEPEPLRRRYGVNPFGQGCLLARRLLERGVRFVDVTLSGVAGQPQLGWDSHADNFNLVGNLCGVLDPAWATLLDDLRDRGLLDSTLVIWMGEFGRTPTINANGGRDHFPDAWSAVLAGGPVRGGQVVGATSTDGREIVDRPVSVPDFLATALTALGVDDLAENMSNVGRPIRVIDSEAVVLQDALA